MLVSSTIAGASGVSGGGTHACSCAVPVDYEVTPGKYSVTSSPPAGVTVTTNTCTDVVVPPGGTVTCSIVTTQASCQPAPFGHLVVNRTSCPTDDKTLVSITIAGDGDIGRAACRSLSQ